MGRHFVYILIWFKFVTKFKIFLTIFANNFIARVCFSLSKREDPAENYIVDGAFGKKIMTGRKDLSLCASARLNGVVYEFSGKSDIFYP